MDVTKCFLSVMNILMVSLSLKLGKVIEENVP